MLSRLLGKNRPPAHVEVWGFLEQNGRFWRRVAAACLVWAFLALAGAAWAVQKAYYEPVAYHVSDGGEATHVGKLRAHPGPADVEVRFLGKYFLKRYLSFNSLTIESDWADAWNLMTDELRAAQKVEWTRFEKENGISFVTHVKTQGIQTELEFNDSRTEVQDHNGKSFTVRLRGQMKTWPLSRVADDTAVLVKDFETMVTLVTCPRTEQTPNGLLVAKVVTRTFVAGEDTPDATATHNNNNEVP